MIFALLVWLKLQQILADDAGSRKTAICVKQKFLNVFSPIATNTDNFLEFVNRSDVYVDKSLLIKDLLEVKRPVVRITYPSKWGKSLCLNMLKTFFELDSFALSNKSIEYPSLTNRSSYQYFTEGKIVLAGTNFTQRLKNPPLISTHEDIISKYLGKYPVIYLDLSNCRGKNIVTLLRRINQAFNKTYHEHCYLKNVLRSGSNAKTLNSLLHSTQYNETRITGSLRFLSRMLCKYNDRKAFIFIDGYDTPINEAYFGNGKFKLEDKNRIVSFLIKLLQNSFIKNDFLEKGVIVGNFEILQHKCFNSTRYVKRYNLLYPSEFFAFNENEVRQIFQEVNLASDLGEKAISWYGGYKVSKNEQSLLNPWSIAEFLKTKQLSSDWSQPTLEELLFKMMITNDHVASTLKSFAEGTRKSVSVFDLDFNQQELSDLSEIINGSLLFRIFDEKTNTLLISYLYAAGFLTLSEDTDAVNSKMAVSLKIPNGEVSTAISSYIEKFVDAMKLTTTTVRTIEPIYDDFVRPVILDKQAMRISHKPREYKLI